MSKKSQRSAVGGAKKKVDRPRRQKDQRQPHPSGSASGPQGRRGPFNNGPGNNFNQGNQGQIRFPGNFPQGQGYGPPSHQSSQQYGPPGNGAQWRGKNSPQMNNQNFQQHNFPQQNNQNFQQQRHSMEPIGQAEKSIPVQRPPRNFQVDGALQRKFYKVSYWKSLKNCHVIFC